MIDFQHIRALANGGSPVLLVVDDSTPGHEWETMVAAFADSNVTMTIDRGRTLEQIGAENPDCLVVGYHQFTVPPEPAPDPEPTVYPMFAPIHEAITRASRVTEHPPGTEQFSRVVCEFLEASGWMWR